MQQVDLYRELSQYLSASDAARVMAALRQDPIVWKSFSNVGLLQNMTEQAGNQVSYWSPGFTALQALGLERTPQDLAADPMQSLDAAWQERILQTYQNIQAPTADIFPAQSSSQESEDQKSLRVLREAGLLALALRERRRLTGNWNGLLSEIHTKATQPGGSMALWRAAVACLYTLIPDSKEMLRALLPRSSAKISFEWFVHAQLCQPVTDQAHCDVFTELLQGQPLVLQLGVLRSLSLHGRSEVAAVLASTLLSGHPAFSLLRSQVGLGDLDLPGVAARALALQQMGALYQLSGNRAQSLSLLRSVESTLKHWLAGLYLQEMSLSLGDQGADPVILEEEKVSSIVSSSGRMKSELGAVLAAHPYGGTLVEHLKTDTKDPFLMIKTASRLVNQGDAAVAQDLARQGAVGLLDQLHKNGLPFNGDFVYDWQPEQVVRILLDLGLTDEALEIAQAFLEVRPTDTHLLYLISRVCESMGNLQMAQKYAQISVGLEPENTAWHSHLAQLWVRLEEWQMAFQSYGKVLALSNSPELKDRLEYAQVALRAGAYDQAKEACEKCLEESLDNGLAVGILGQALLGLGDQEKSLVYLNRATLLAPEILPPWLALARLQQEKGETQTALETLRAAVTAAPDAVEGRLALADVCLAEGLMTEALPHLKQAFNITPGSGKAALLYATTLRTLGHMQEARSVLERTRVLWNNQPNLAHLFAQVALEQGDTQSALPALEAALRAPKPPMDWYMQYVRILLGEDPQYCAGQDTEAREMQRRQADAALRRVLEMEPGQVEASYYAAQIMLERGELETALNLFQALVETREDLTTELLWKVQWGLGRSALRLGQTETALAALKEAAQTRPNCLELQRDLANTSMRANLPKEALAAAEYALQLGPDNLQNLNWFADFVAPLGEVSKAREALECAVQLEPNRANQRIRLAQWQLATGDLRAARASLEALHEIDQVSSAELRQAAHTYMRMEDTGAALSCLEQALLQESYPSLDLLYEVACLYNRNGNVESALTTAQRALNDPVFSSREESIPLYLLQAELLTRLNRSQAALASLERALRIVQGQGEGPLQPAAKDSLCEIHQRFSNLLFQNGNIPEALHHMEKALELTPGHPGLRGRAAELAMALLQIDRAAKLVNTLPESAEEIDPASSVSISALEAMLADSQEDGLDLLSLQIEIALESGQDTGVERLIDAGLFHAPQHSRLLAAQARCLARQGDLTSARHLFDRLHQEWVKKGNGKTAGLWLAEAALEAQRWEKTFSILDQYILAHPGEARGYFSLARALVLCAERQRTCEALDCQTNAPGAAALEDASRKKFADAVEMVGKLANTNEIHRWEARGQAVFNPSLQSARELALLNPTAQDTAALVAVLRFIRNRSAALQTARRNADAPLVLLQKALCYLEPQAADDPDQEDGVPLDALSTAEQLVESSPGEPLHHAVYALLQEKAGDLFRALDAYEKALQLWPQEAGWHDAASDLAIALGDILVGLDHREQALKLDPGSQRYALKLGQACLTAENPSRAIEVLEAACPRSESEDEDTPLESNPTLAAIWLCLARAYHMAGNQTEALEAAIKASEMDPTSGEGFLTAGETALALNKQQDALDYARKAVLRDPENVSGLLFLSRVLVQQGQNEEALAVLDESAASVRNLFPVAMERARLIYRLNGAQAVLEMLERLAQEYPDEPELLAFLAQSQMESGDLRSAERQASKSLRLDPGQPDLALLLGRLQRKSGQLDQAVHLLTDVIRMAPDRLEAYLELGSVYQERREFLQALQIYRQAMRVAPDDYQAYYQSGLILRDSKDYAGAETMLRQAAELAPESLGIRRQLVAVITLNLVHSKQEVK